MRNRLCQQTTLTERLFEIVNCPPPHRKLLDFAPLVNYWIWYSLKSFLSNLHQNASFRQKFKAALTRTIRASAAYFS